MPCNCRPHVTPCSFSFSHPDVLFQVSCCSLRSGLLDRLCLAEKCNTCCWGYYLHVHVERCMLEQRLRHVITVWLLRDESKWNACGSTIFASLHADDGSTIIDYIFEYRPILESIEHCSASYDYGNMYRRLRRMGMYPRVHNHSPKPLIVP